MGVEFPVSFNVACGAACDAGWQCLFIAWSSTTTLEFLETVRQVPDQRGTPSARTRVRQAPDRRVRYVWCSSQRTKKSLHARDETGNSRGRGLGRPGWPRVLLTSERGAAQRDFDRRRGSPPPAVVASGLHFPVNLTFDQHGGLWFTSNVVGGNNNPTNGVWYIPPGGRPRQVVKGLAPAGLAWVGNNLYVASTTAPGTGEITVLTGFNGSHFASQRVRLDGLTVGSTSSARSRPDLTDTSTSVAAPRATITDRREASCRLRPTAAAPW
jgi:hypothetical protein